MKRRALLSHLRRYGCTLVREGAKHSLYANTGSGAKSTDPRHTDIPDRLAVKICRDLGVPTPGESPSPHRDAVHS